jgi:hypothetical protein
MTELWQLGALEIADAIRTGEATSRDVLDALLARVDAVNGDLNAVVALIGDEAFAAADAADAAVANGDHLGPLHGVPISVKENIDVAGFATTQGIVAFAHAIASGAGDGLTATTARLLAPEAGGCGPPRRIPSDAEVWAGIFSIMGGIPPRPRNGKNPAQTSDPSRTRQQHPLQVQCACTWRRQPTHQRLNRAWQVP